MTQIRDYKYMVICVRNELIGGKPSYSVRNKRSGDEIGCIAMYSKWRRYCFSAIDGAIFSPDCLIDIADFINNHAGK